MKMTEWIARAAMACLVLQPTWVGAQVITDGTVGPAGALGGPNYDINADLGRQAGGNLFHSFSQFDVGSAEVATFSGPTSVANIVARVTGGRASSIDGTLRSTVAGADLYFLNPNGVLFGELSQLDVQGSFYVSSADFVEFADGARFDAVNPAASRITVAPPSAFGFGNRPHGALTVRRTVLEVPRFERLALVGGDVALDGGVVIAPAGEVAIVSAVGSGSVPIGGVGDVSLESISGGGVRMTPVDVPSSPGRGSVPDQNVDTRFFDGPLRGGGRVSIRGGRLIVEGGGVISGGGDIDIKTSQDVLLNSSAGLVAGRQATGAFSEAPTRAGTISVETDVLSLQGGSRIVSIGATGVDSGEIALNVGSLRMGDLSTIDVSGSFSGNGGLVDVVAGSVEVDGNARITAGAAFGNTGEGGRISLHADSVRLSEGAAIDTTSVFSRGSGGVVSIDAGRVEIVDSALLFALSASEEAAGRVEVRADELTMMDRAGITTNTLFGGRGGSIEIEVGRLDMSGASVITSGTEGVGQGGDMRITLESGLLRDEAVISSESEGDNDLIARVIDIPAAPTGGGTGGTVSVAGGTLRLQDGAQIIGATAGQGDAGQVKLRVDSLTLLERARIAALSDSSGLAGDVDIDGGSTVRLEGGAITTSAQRSDGGNIVLKARDLIYLNGAEITTSVNELNGDGGNIDIDPVFVVLNDARIVARAQRGAGGNIQITAQSFITDPVSVVDASSQFGLDGNVFIESPEQDVSESLGSLAADFLDASTLVSTPCAQRTRAQASSLVVIPGGAVLPSPDDLQHMSVFSHWISIDQGASSTHEISSTQARAGSPGVWAEGHDCSNSTGG